MPLPGSKIMADRECLQPVQKDRIRPRNRRWMASDVRKAHRYVRLAAPMRFDLITIFPEFFAGPLDHGILRRARETGLLEVHVQDLRVFTKDRHRSVDDRPFGGGEGMVLKPEPLFEAAESLLGHSLGSAEQPTVLAPKTAIVLMSAAGKLFRQETARRYAQIDRLV